MTIRDSATIRSVRLTDAQARALFNARQLTDAPVFMWPPGISDGDEYMPTRTADVLLRKGLLEVTESYLTPGKRKRRVRRVVITDAGRAALEVHYV